MLSSTIYNINMNLHNISKTILGVGVFALLGIIAAFLYSNLFNGGEAGGLDVISAVFLGPLLVCIPIGVLLAAIAMRKKDAPVGTHLPETSKSDLIVVWSVRILSAFMLLVALFIAFPELFGL